MYTLADKTDYFVLPSCSFNTKNYYVFERESAFVFSLSSNRQGLFQNKGKGGKSVEKRNERMESATTEIEEPQYLVSAL